MSPGRLTPMWPCRIPLPLAASTPPWRSSAMKPEHGPTRSTLTGEAICPTEAMRQLSCLASGLVESGRASDGDYATWPLLAVPELLAGQIGSDFRPEPKQILVHESLFIACHRRPDEAERFSFCISLSGAEMLGADIVLVDRRDGKLARLQAQLRWIDLAALSRIKPISLTRAARGADLAQTRTGIVTQNAIDVFVRLCGDPNPLHNRPRLCAHGRAEGDGHSRRHAGGAGSARRFGLRIWVLI